MSRFQQIKKLSKEEKKFLKTLDAKIKTYEKEKKKAGCGLCNVYRKELSNNVPEKMHALCDNCKYHVPVIQAYRELLSAKSRLNDFEEKQYGKTIFDTLSVETPDLIDTKTGNVVKWIEVFGKSYSDNVPGKRYKLLIGLFEKNMKMRYRLK